MYCVYVKKIEKEKKEMALLGDTLGDTLWH